MRLLVVNSNTTPAVTERIAGEARRAAAAGTEVTAVSAPFGLPLIVTASDALVAGTATLAALGAARGSYDAAIIACFGDPGLEAAKERVGVPVLGISEAAFHAAAMLGRRFGVVCFTRALVPMYEDCLARRGLAARCSGFRSGPAFSGDPGTVAEDRAAMVLELIEEAVRLDGADVVIVAGGPLAGLARSLAPHTAVPLIDGVTAAVALAEALVRFAPTVPRCAGGVSTGLAPGLSALFQ